MDVPAGQAIERVDFGNTTEGGGEIHGTKWLDRNGDGQRGSDEPVLKGWTIYLDSNSNGRLDSTEPSEVTNENGEYWFMDLPTGTYTVAEVQQEGWTQTFPGGGAGARNYIEFEDQKVDSPVRVGSTVQAEATDGTTFNAQAIPFTFLDGRTSSLGFARAASTNNAASSGLEMQLNNIALEFELGASDGVSFNYADFGGIVNL